MFAFTAASSAATGYVPVFFTAKSSTASWKLCMFAFTLASRARSCMAMKFGIAIAARIPMITTTIMSSMSVKPFWLRNIVSSSSLLTVGQRQSQKRSLAEASDRVARRQGRVGADNARRRRIRAPRPGVVCAREGILRVVASRHIRHHRCIVRGHWICAVVLHGEVFDRQLVAMHVPFHAGFACAVLHGDEVWNRDRRENPDDHDDDHQLDEGEALRVSRHGVLHLLSGPVLPDVISVRPTLPGRDQSNGHAIARPAPSSGVLACTSARGMNGAWLRRCVFRAGCTRVAVHS